MDFVKYHEAYHRLMTLGLESGIHSAPWADPKPGAHVPGRHRAICKVRWRQAMAAR